jgi:hypothetical protein
VANEPKEVEQEDSGARDSLLDFIQEEDEDEDGADSGSSSESSSSDIPEDSTDDSDDTENTNLNPHASRLRPQQDEHPEPEIVVQRRQPMFRSRDHRTNAARYPKRQRRWTRRSPSRVWF